MRIGTVRIAALEAAHAGSMSRAKIRQSASGTRTYSGAA